MKTLRQICKYEHMLPNVILLFIKCYHYYYYYVGSTYALCQPLTLKVLIFFYKPWTSKGYFSCQNLTSTNSAGIDFSRHNLTSVDVRF